MPRPNIIYIACRAGGWLIRKARAQAQAKGTFTAAANLRKQGVPMDLALAILLGK
jgi:hypothetical protein